MKERLKTCRRSNFQNFGVLNHATVVKSSDDYRHGYSLVSNVSGCETFRGFYANWSQKGKERGLPLIREWAKTDAQS